MSDLNKLENDYTRELIAWTKAWETKRLIQELDNMDKLLEVDVCSDVILFDIFDKLYEAIRDELIERLKISYKDS